MRRLNTHNEFWTNATLLRCSCICLPVYILTVMTMTCSYNSTYCFLTTCYEKPQLCPLDASFITLYSRYIPTISQEWGFLVLIKYSIFTTGAMTELLHRAYESISFHILNTWHHLASLFGQKNDPRQHYMTCIETRDWDYKSLTIHIKNRNMNN